MSAIQIVQDADDWMYDLEQINKERNLTRHEYCVYNKLRMIRDKYYDIHKKQIEYKNNHSSKVGYCVSFKCGRKRLNGIMNKNNKGRLIKC